MTGGLDLEDRVENFDDTELLNLLERASKLLDRMWNEARDLERSDLSIQLGQASHSLHRTLLALRQRD